MNDEVTEPTNRDDDAFEHRLINLPRRSAPPGWRKEVLAAARANLPVERPATGTFAALFEALLRRFPVAWAGLAAMWIFILCANRTDRWLNGVVAHQAPRLSAEQLATVRAQRAELWVLAGLDRSAVDERQPADRSRDPILRPRSSLRRPTGLESGSLRANQNTLNV